MRRHDASSYVRLLERPQERDDVLLLLRLELEPQHQHDVGAARAGSLTIRATSGSGDDLVAEPMIGLGREPAEPTTFSGAGEPWGGSRRFP